MIHFCITCGYFLTKALTYDFKKKMTKNKQRNKLNN